MSLTRTAGARIISAVALTLAAAAAQAQADYAAIDASPALWSISDDDSTVYLFGTVHILPPKLDWKTDQVRASLNEAEIVYFEADVLSPDAQAVSEALIPQLGLNPPGVTLSTQISDAALADVAVVAERIGAPAEVLMQQLDPLQPWLASLTLAILQVQADGYHPASGVEVQLNETAAQAGKRFGYFETMEQQLRFLADAPIELQIRDFEIGIRQMVEEPEMLSDLVQAWATGDMETLDVLFNAAMRDSSPELFERLIVDRNAAWIPQIEAALDGPEDAFVAVGVGHMPGEYGVIALLKARGHTVHRR